MKLLSNDEYAIIFAVQSLYLSDSERNHTVNELNKYVDAVLQLKPEEYRNRIDKQSVVAELIRRNSIWTGEAKVLYSTEGHQDWLNSDRKRGWVYWPRYKKLLEKQIAQSVADDIDNVTDQILGLLEDPKRHNPWDRRGLVVGHVQSGKTSNYTGLICKAADAGYRIIIVLAGLTNSLRTQTQVRLEEGFLGYITGPSDSNQFLLTGVGLIDRDMSIRPNHVTNRLQNGDFKLGVAKNLGITPEQRPWLFVVKKNKPILDSIYNWLRNYVADYTDDQGEKHITSLPLLLIDDESDNASVDTGNNVIRDDGTPDEDHNPKAINKGIRKILKIFTRSAYVGYTATPFANIFIHDQGETKHEGKDLFPESFIINLSASSEYFGPVRMFGIQNPDSEVKSLSTYLTCKINDVPSVGGWMPAQHKSIHIPTTERHSRLPKSLEDAILSFLLVCATRRLRGQKTAHSSMLVHVSRYMAVQEIISKHISNYVQYCKNRIVRNQECQELWERLEALWLSDFSINSPKVLELANQGSELMPQWETVKNELPAVLEDMTVMLLNGNSKDVLEYEEHKNIGLKVIAIGGDKLSRGLTLEGLSISYFIRCSNMYDTLMQMGRWFGYRRGYLDLCRLYTTPDLIKWFEQITDATEKLRSEFDIMQEQKLTPKDYGLRVQHYPDLQVTSKDKSRSAKEWSLNFEGSLVQTIVFHRDAEILTKNFKTTQALLGTLGDPSQINPSIVTNSGINRWEGALWKNVGAKHIKDFLNGYITHRSATKVSSEALIEFIQEMNKDGYLDLWTVSLIGASEKGSEERNKYQFGKDLLIPSIYRANANPELLDRYSIKVLTSPRDEAIDFDSSFYKEALELSIKIRTEDAARTGEVVKGDVKSASLKGIAARTIRAKHLGSDIDRGLLNLYVIDSSALDVPETLPIVGFSVSLPNTRTGKTVNYKVNHVFTELWEFEEDEY